MRNNKTILDDAARSVRRTFIGSVAGSVVMLAVVGAAGAYGMPEKLTAQAFNAAMAKFNVKFAPKAEHAAPAVAEQPVKVASNAKILTVSPVTDAADELVMQTAPAAETAPVSNPFSNRDPAPAVTASLAPRALPNVAEERPFLAAPLVFEVPKPADAQVLTELPKTEVIVVAPQPAETPKPAKSPVVETPKPVEKPKVASAPAEQAVAVAEPVAAEFPKSVMVRLPVAKPPLTPAQRLDLIGKDYDKAEKCLAQAIYFEARNEPARGQQAVAQVVLNRVFSPYYPKDVCSVVYQNAHRHLSCQFTFACDGKPEAVNERGAWTRANRIAKQTLDAKIWLPEVNKATHYHAAYVRPNWIRDMNVMVRHGLHTFYRPRNWGDGSGEANWATASNSVKSAPTGVKPLTPAQKKFAYGRT